MAKKKNQGKPVIIRNKRGREICGAKKRDGTMCGQTRLLSGGRCRSHGGSNHPAGPSHPSWKNGRGSRLLKKLPVHLRKTFRQSLNDPDILSLKAELGLLDAHIINQVEKLSTNESELMIEALSLGLTRMLDILHDAEDEVDVDELEEEIESLFRIVGGSLRDRSAWGKIRETIEIRRRVSDTERKLLEAQQHAIDAVQLRSLVTFFVASLKQHVLPLEGGRDAVLGVSKDIAQIMTGADIDPEPLDASNGIEV